MRKIKDCSNKIKKYLSKIGEHKRMALMLFLLGAITLILGEGATVFVFATMISIALFLYKDDEKES